LIPMTTPIALFKFKAWTLMHDSIQRALSSINRKSAGDWIEFVGLVGLFIFTFNIFNKSSMALKGIMLMVIPLLILSKSFAKEWTRDHLLWFSIIFLLFLTISSIWNVVEFENHQAFTLQGTVTHLMGGFFLTFLVAFWLNRARGKWDWLMLVLLAGFLAQILRKMEWANCLEMACQFWSGSRRATFGSSATQFGLWSSVSFLCCILLYREFLGSAANRILSWTRNAFWLTMTIVSFFGIVFSQSRSAWLAAVSVTLPMIAYSQLCNQSYKYKLLWVIAFMVFSASLFLTNLSDIVVNRISSSVELLRNLPSDSGLPSSETAPSHMISILERFQIYQLFWETWKQHPFLGYGPGSSMTLLEVDTNMFREHYRDFHSLPFEILIQTGILGLVIFSAFLTIVFKQLSYSVHSGGVGLPYLFFALGGCLMILIYGFFSNPFSNIRGIYLFSFLCGICYESKFSKISVANMA